MNDDTKFITWVLFNECTNIWSFLAYSPPVMKAGIITWNRTAYTLWYFNLFHLLKQQVFPVKGWAAIQYKVSNSNIFTWGVSARLLSLSMSILSITRYVHQSRVTFNAIHLCAGISTYTTLQKLLLLTPTENFINSTSMIDNKRRKCCKLTLF